MFPVNSDMEKQELYHDVSGSLESLLDGEEDRSRHEGLSPRTRSCTVSVLTCCNILLLVVTTVLFVGSQQTPSTQTALKATSTYSPVLEDFDLRLQTTRLNGSLFPGPDPSPWRGTPDDPQSEAAWDAFEHIRTIPMTRNQILKMGKDPSKAAKFEDSIWHMGDDAYVGALDIFHQVHCLNMLRKAAFQGNNGLAAQPGLERIHLQHCTDMLMQHLLCTADTGLLTYQWVEDNEHPFPDFSVNRQCKDWTQLVEYRDEHAVDLEKYMGYTKPVGVEEIPQPPEYWELMKEMNETGEGHQR